MSEINKQLFKELESRMEKNDYSFGRSHPVNLLFNLQDDIIQGYELITKLKKRKDELQSALSKIDCILAGKL